MNSAHPGHLEDVLELELMEVSGTKKTQIRQDFHCRSASSGFLPTLMLPLYLFADWLLLFTPECSSCTSLVCISRRAGVRVQAWALGDLKTVISSYVSDFLLGLSAPLFLSSSNLLVFEIHRKWTIPFILWNLVPLFSLLEPSSPEVGLVSAFFPVTSFFPYHFLHGQQERSV